MSFSSPLHPQSKIIKIAKLAAARSQLETAIELWFIDGDPVSIHTLSHSAYEVIHVVSKKRNRDRRDLLFDSLTIKDEHRKEWNLFLKNPGNFFKHAKDDPDDSIEFAPALSELFILYAILGVELSGARHSATESAFMLWLCFHHPDLLTDKGRKQFVDSIPIDQLDNLRSIPKKDFLNLWRKARALRGG